MSSSEDYSYITVCEVRDYRATTDPPSYKPSDVTYEYPHHDIIRPRANALNSNSKTLEYRKQSDPFVNGHGVFGKEQLTKELKTKISPKTRDPKPKIQKLSLGAKTIPFGPSKHSSNITRSDDIHRSKSVENLDGITAPPLNISKIPIDSPQASNLSKNKSSSMNLLNNRKVTVTPKPATPGINSDNAYMPPSPYQENIYEELDDQVKTEIKGSDRDYVTFLTTIENKAKVNEHLTSNNRPPEPLPSSAHVNSTKPMTLPSRTQNIPFTNAAKHKTAPKLPDRPNLEARKSANRKDQNAIHSPGQKRPKPDFGNKLKNSPPTQALSSKNSHPSNDAASKLAREPSFNFSLPYVDSLAYVTSVPLYSLQRSQDFTSEFSKMNEFYGNGKGLDLIDDSDLSDDESNYYDFNSLPRGLDPKSFLVETSLPASIESSDYATYDNILKRISRYSKKATSNGSSKLLHNQISTDYVTYDTAMSAVVRSRSLELEGYVTTGEVLQRQKNDSYMQAVNYVNTKQGIKNTAHRPAPTRPNKIPQPSPRDSQAPKPSPRSKPSRNSTPNKPLNPNSYSRISPTKSFDDPDYIQEDDPHLKNRLKPGRLDRDELFIHSFHEYADSKLVDSPDPTPSPMENRFSTKSSLKMSKRRKSILKQPSRNPSLYTNYIDNTSILRSTYRENVEVEYDYIAPIELRIPFRVSWAPLFFNDESSYVPNMEVAKLLSALNVTNHYNEGWDFEQYQSTVNTKARKQPPPIPPKTASMLRETNKRWHKFRPSLRDTPEDETVIPLSRYGSMIQKVSFRASFSALSQFSSTSTTASMESCFIEESMPISPLPAFRPNSRGTFPSRPILPPYKEVPELPNTSPNTTPFRVDEDGDPITRSQSESKIDSSAISPFSPVFSESHTLNRLQAKEKKLKNSESKNITSFDSDGAMTPDASSGAKKLVSTPSLDRDTLHLSYSKTILLGDEHVVQAQNSGVSLGIPACDAIAVAKKMGGLETIEISIDIFTNYNYWETKLDPSKRFLHREREKYINLSPIVSISCNVSPPPNLGTMLLTIPICGQLEGWHYQLLHKDIDNLYHSERKDKQASYKWFNDRVEISTASFGYYCIKGKYQEKHVKHICVKKVVFFGLRMLFKLDKIQIGMCNDTPDDIKIFKEEMHKRHLRAIISQPCHYQLRYLPQPPPLKVNLQVDKHTELEQKAISFMSAWKMIPTNDCEVENPLTPSCTFTLPSSSHTLLLFIKLPNNNIEFSLNS